MGKPSLLSSLPPFPFFSHHHLSHSHYSNGHFLSFYTLSSMPCMHWMVWESQGTIQKESEEEGEAGGEEGSNDGWGR